MMGDRPTVLTEDDVAELRAGGHSFGIHHDALGVWADGEDQELVIEDIVRRDVATFEQRFGSRPLVKAESRCERLRHCSGSVCG